MSQPTAFEKSTLVAICASAIMHSPESWREFEHESNENESFENWATRRAFIMAKNIFKNISES